MRSPSLKEQLFTRQWLRGKPCGQEYALIKAGTDGLRYFPIQIPTKVLFPGVLLYFIISFNYKGGTYTGVVVLLYQEAS